MLKVGIIAEFNPLHNGHIYFINKIKKEFNDPYIIALISSSFVQRGEPAILDKWQRASLALKAGVNLVVELPFIFACQNAEVFSKGAISILKNFNIDYLVFGSENKEDKLIELSKKLDLAYNNKDFHRLVKSYLRKGNSYILSRNNALRNLKFLNIEDMDIISRPNNILALEYISAIRYFNLNTKIKAIKRQGPSHDSMKTEKNIASASFIRENLSKDIDRYIPVFTKKELENRKTINDRSLIDLIKYDLSFYENLKNTWDYEDGLENRLLDFAYTSKSLDDLASKATSKRMTKSRIKRSIINSLVQTKKNLSIEAYGANYIRLLASDSKGFELLKDLKKDKISNFKEVRKLSPQIQDIAYYEVRASNLYSIITNDIYNKDFYSNPIIKRP